MIEFLRDHAVGEGDARECFEKGQVVKDRSAESELHFVRRGHAAFRDGKTGALTDHEGKPVERPAEAGEPGAEAGSVTSPRATSRRRGARSA